MTDVRPELSLDPETAFFILMKARELDAKVEESDPDSGSNPSDDRSVDVLEFARLRSRLRRAGFGGAGAERR